MAIRQEGNTYYGLSTDTKPTGAVLNGREFKEMDTGKKYLFDAENGEWLEQPEEGGGGGGGSSTLSGLTDVDISNPSDGQTLVYNATSGKWENGAGGGGLTVLQGTYDDEHEQLTLEVTCSELYSMCQDGVVGVQYVQHIEYEPGDEQDKTYLRLISQALMDVGTNTGTSYVFVLGESTAFGGTNDIVVFTDQK